jgi:hypothetical protein
LRRLNGVALSKIYEITQVNRAFLQFLHPNPIQSPLAGFCSVQFRATVSRFSDECLLSKK